MCKCCMRGLLCPWCGVRLLFCYAKDGVSFRIECKSCHTNTQEYPDREGEHERAILEWDGDPKLLWTLAREGEHLF